MIEKKRLDVAVFERGLAPSREKARAFIMAGQVYVNGQKSTKAGQPVKDEEQIEVRSNPLPYVSRGGLKLDKAMQVFSITLKNAVCMDVGASTGGFTDCMLQNGAKKVYAIDVGYGQLAWQLRTDPRVINLERTNFRYVTQEDVPEAIDFASVDVSFISLSLIFPVLYQRLHNTGHAVCLIKPQFEAGKDKVGKNGVVREQDTHCQVIEKVIHLAIENGFTVKGIDFSPVKGPKGNIEYLLYICKEDAPGNLSKQTTESLVQLSHETLNGGDTP